MASNNRNGGRGRPTNSLVPAPAGASARPLTIQQTANNPQQPRQPNNLQGLLAYSMQARGDQEGPNEGLQPLSAENRQWLDEALKSMSVNVIEELTKAIGIIQQAGLMSRNDDVQDAESALDAITSYIDNMDIANDFHKIGGFTIFSPLLNSGHASLRSKAANLIAELTQNNEYCQSRVTDVLPRLLEMVRSDPDPECRVKALYAISCSLRDYPPSLEHFIKHDGFSVLLCAMQSSIDKLKIKSSFLLSALCSESNDVKVQVFEMGMVEQLAALLQADGQPHEHLLSALLALVRDHPRAQQECRRPLLGLRATAERLQTQAAKEENLEQQEYCRELCTLVFAGGVERQDR